LIRVAVLSQNPTLRIGLRELLSSHSGLEVVSEAASFEEFEAFEAETDVLVLASVPLSELRLVNFDLPPLLLLTEDPEDVDAIRASPARTWGVIPLDAAEDELIASVHAVGQGLWVGAPRLVGGLLRPPAGRETLSGEAPHEALTAREKEVLQLTAQGLANKQIALSLGISEHTVKFHLSSLYMKLAVSGRTEAIRRGFELGLISL
jgi:DNA-binding NarL/FixJ family response regulator